MCQHRSRRRLIDFQQGYAKYQIMCRDCGLATQELPTAMHARFAWIKMLVAETGGFQLPEQALARPN